MRSSSTRPVRIPPVPPEERDELTRELLTRANRTPGRDVNIYSTFVNRPELFEMWLDLAHGLLFRGKLDGYDREIVVLRTAWNCESEYEWAQHVRIAREVGVSDAEIIAIENGAADPIWSERPAVLLTVADELHDRSVVSDTTWAKLAKYYDSELMYELTMLVGVYHLVAMMLNTFGVQLDDEVSDISPVKI